jgi:hypothetical protein
MPAAATANAKQQQPQPQAATFTDRHGRTWDLELTLGSARRIDASDYSALTDRQIVILRPDKEVFGELLTNTPLLCAVAWTVAKPQADKLPCPECGCKGGPCDYCNGTGTFSESSFVDGLTATAISDLRRALWESLCRFFPDRKTALSICLRQYEAGVEAAGQELAGMEREIGEEIEREVREKIKELPAAWRKLLAENVASRRSNLTSGESVGE